MAKIKIQVQDFEFHVPWDLSGDPLTILLTAEGEEGEAEALEAKYVSGTLVSTTKGSPE